MSTPTIRGILQVHVADASDEYPILQPALELGRGADSDIILEDPQTSRRHALLSATPEGFKIQDQGSANGTLVNDQPLPPRHPWPLQPGDTIQIAGFQLTVRLPTAEAPPPPVLGERVQINVHPQPGLAIYYEGKVLKVPLDKPQITLGRQSDNDVVIPSRVASAHHARIEGAPPREPGGLTTYRIVDLGSTNGLVYDGQRISQKDLVDGDVLYITDQVAIQFRAFIGFLPVEQIEQEVITERLPTDEEPVRIGRAPDNQLVLDHPQISRYHAIIERMGVGRYRVRDLKSTNGVFVNNDKVDEAWLKEGDQIQIGPFQLDMKEGGIRQLADAGLRLDARRLQQWVSKDKNLLQEISLSIYPQEFVALVGLSGAGKSTLMNALNGFWPATNGAVYVNDVNLYRNFDLFRSELGYVPQKDIVHMELTVYQALDYAAQLRMPADTSSAERHDRITEMLEDLDLTERKDLPIHKLSGGQLKRVSIGVELLTKPRLFFLDEPTSGLDPGTEYNMMKLMRRLADQGRTIVLITHATKNVMMCDKVVFIVRGGHVAYYGPPEEALVYFDRYRTDQERREKDMEFDNIYIVLEDEKRGSPEQWAERYQRSSEYRKYVVERLQEHKQVTPAGGLTPTAAVRRFFGGTGQRISAMRQLVILSSRNLKILMQDRLSLALMLLVAPAIGMMGFMWGRALFDPVEGDPAKIITMLFMDGLIAILVGAISSVLQIVRENDIYKRERIVGLKIGPYILSKVWIGVLLSLYQALVLLILKVIFVNPVLPGPDAYVAVYITLFLGTLSGYLFGLAISAGAPNLNVAMLLVIVVLVPQFLFAGALLPLDLIAGGEAISVVASTRWAFEGLVNITGMGDNVVNDPCWGDRPKYDEEGQIGWNTLLNADDERKRAEGCTCMGSAIFETCDDFPGILSSDYYDEAAQAALVSSEPVQPGTPTPHPSPTPYPSPTPHPTLTPYPALTPYPTPQNPQDMGGYMDLREEQGNEYSDLRQEQGDVYQDIRERQGEEYADLRQEQGDEYQDLRQQQGDQYADDMDLWGDQKADWQRDREQAIQGAEGMLKSIFENYGRSFKGTVVSRWAAMGGIMLGLILLILFFQKRKDVV